MGIFYKLVFFISEVGLIFPIYGAVNEDIGGNICFVCSFKFFFGYTVIDIMELMPFVLMVSAVFRAIPTADYENKYISGSGFSITRFVEGSVRHVGDVPLLKKNGLIADRLDKLFQR